ncbi:MAG: hypothetical protein ACOYO1_04970 [Bacteroidales bacterium]
MAKNKQCDPLLNNINVPMGPPLPGAPGFSFDSNMFGFIPPDLGDFPGNILDWIKKLKFNLPGGGLLQEMIESLTETISKVLSRLLSYLNIIMGFLMFALAIVELIMCIIKILCAFPKPWSVIRAIKRLLTKCLPIFITICFPFFVWILLLLSLIAILIAIIEYIVMMIIRLIKQIIKNIKRIINLLKASRNVAGALAIISKLANLLCLFEQIFVFLGIVFALFEIIMGQWTKALKICDSGGGPDDDSICAEFLKDPTEKDNPDIEIYKTRVASSTADLWYCNEVYGSPNSDPLFSTIITQLRAESIYLQDDSLAEELKFKNIINYKGFPFFPFDKNINKDIEYRMKPYLVDLYITCDPGDGLRRINVKDVTVTCAQTSMLKTIISSKKYPVYNNNGFITLYGGKVVDDISKNDKTIEELLHKDATQLGGISTQYTKIEYVLKANYDALAEYALITTSCMPSVQVHLGVLNTVFNKIPLPDLVQLPDVGGAIDKLSACLSEYRKSMTLETTETFGNCMLNIMSDLNDQANSSYCQLLQAAMDIYHMPITLDKDLQFINKKIKVTVTPKDEAGRTLIELIGGFTPPQSCMDTIASKFKGEATLGTVSNFSYDGYGNFIADIISQTSGDGYITVSYDGNTIKKVIKPSDPSLNPSIEDYILNYSYVGFITVDGYIPAPRRDESDSTI